MCWELNNAVLGDAKRKITKEMIVKKKRVVFAGFESGAYSFFRGYGPHSKVALSLM